MIQTRKFFFPARATVRLMPSTAMEPFHDDVTQEGRAGFDVKHMIAALALPAGDLPHPVDVAGDEMAAEFSAHAQGRVRD